ncbi:hypothetical protein [Tenacibaculum sp. M341]|uniref:hypothetical protein n=1 Tax=Tenacibaculum sp. M341 TaxID=2530339 RepID=UPI00104AC50C|nr:hypothetical protein [Tenacibaculum sp. M341]TCI90354.1 hypothetical protein EYW44_14060 [Tenacibaculum sp. M341]
MRIAEFCKKEIASILDEVMEFWSTKAIDHSHGEWYEKLDADKNPIHVPKVNMWKSPYHIVRMCLL